jgi:transcription elongation factor
MMRIATSVFVAAHGIGFSIWFMSSRTPSALGPRTPRLNMLTDVPVTGALGKTVGILALAVAAGFAVAAWGVLTQAPWWPVALLSAAAASLFVALAWNPVGAVSASAVAASAALIAATLMPWGQRFLGPTEQARTSPGAAPRGGQS